MKTIVRLFVISTVIFSTASLAQRLPDYYPDSFQRTGTVDGIGNDRIIINDIPYSLSSSVAVHTLFAEESFISTIRPGTLVGYVVSENRQIIEIWELPSNYERSRRRR